MDLSLSQAAQNEGLRQDINVYRKNRKCKHCHCVLSIYNPGPGCHVHAELLIKKQQLVDEQQNERNRKKSAKNAEKKRKAKI